jgi:hypothetical protein
LRFWVRGAVERMNARLKDLLALRKLRVRGLASVTIFVLLGCIAILLAALLGRLRNKSIREIRSVFG